MYVRELALHTIMRLQEWYGDDLMVLPDLCAKVGVLLADASPSVRQAASHTLVNLFKIFGDSLLSELEDCGEHVVSLTQLKLIKQAIRAAETNGYPVVSLSVEGLDGNSHTPGVNNTHHLLLDDDYDDDDFGLSRGILTNGVTPSGQLSIPSPSLEQPSSSSTRPINATPSNHTITTTATATATNNTAVTRPSSSSSSSSGRSSTPGTGSGTGSGATVSSGIATGNNNLPSSTASDLTNAPATTPTSAFHPSTYMTLLAEGTHPKIVR